MLPHQQALVRELHSRGAGILIGTDSVLPAYVPGFTPIDEMQAIAAGGIENFAVLQAATLKAAQALGVAGERGTVAVGKRASLIVLAEKPGRGPRRALVSQGRPASRTLATPG